MLAKELKSHRKKNMHAFLRTLKGDMNTPTKEEHTHKIKVRGGIALKEMDSFFDWRLGVHLKTTKSITIWRGSERLWDDRQWHTIITWTPRHCNWNIDEEPDENVEEQSARFESDEGEEEVWEFLW